MDLPYYFIAVPLPRFLKKQLELCQETLKAYLPFKQWPHPDDLHVTLKFLGPVSAEQYQTLSTVLADIQKLEAFTLKIGTLGTFGRSDKPRVLWAGIQYKEKLMHLQQRVEYLAEQAGFQQERRPYKPHITLAKKWNGDAKDSSALNMNSMEGQTFKVENIVIYRIHPGKKPMYQKASVYDLMTKGT